MGLHGSEFVVSEISRVRLKLSFDLWVVIRQLPWSARRGQFI